MPGPAGTPRNATAVRWLALLTLYASVPLWSQPTPLGPSFAVNSAPAGRQEYPDVDRGHDGRFVVAWHESGLVAGEEKVVARCFSANGEPGALEFTVADLPVTAGGYPPEPRVALAQDGGFLVVWQQFPSSDDGDSWGRVYDSECDPAGAPFQVHPANPGSQTLPEVVADTDGTFMVVWSYATPAGSPFGARGRRFDPTGTPLAPSFQVVETNRGGTSLSLARESLGQFLVAYVGPPEPGEHGALFARGFNAFGELGPEFVVDETQLYFGTSEPRISSDPRGGFVVSWTDYVFHGSGPRGRRFDASGELESELPYPVGAFEPTADFAADGSLLLSWLQDLTYPLGQLYSPDGQPVGDVFEVSEEEWGIGRGLVAFDAASNPVFVGTTYVGQPDSTELRARLFLAGAILIDGFESGDTSAWSSSEP